MERKGEREREDEKETYGERESPLKLLKVQQRYSKECTYVCTRCLCVFVLGRGTVVPVNAREC